MEIGDKIKIVDQLGYLHAEFRLDGKRALMRAEQKPVFVEQGFVFVITDAPLPEVTIDLEASGIPGYEGSVTITGLVQSPLLVRVVQWMNGPTARAGSFDADFFKTARSPS